MIISKGSSRGRKQNFCTGVSGYGSVAFIAKSITKKEIQIATPPYIPKSNQGLTPALCGVRLKTKVGCFKFSIAIVPFVHQFNYLYFIYIAAFSLQA